jgi:hypothetical protein
MPKIKYQDFRFSDVTRRLIEQSNEIIEEYTAQGFILTLRQVYYKLIARDLFPEDRRWRWTGSKWVRDPNGTKNAEPNYKWLGSIVNDGRLAGLIDWSAIEDRTRNLEVLAKWASPQEIVDSCAKQFHVDMWLGQKHRPECFTPGTPVIVAGKPTSIATVEIGESVFTHERRMRRVLKTIRTPYSGKMLRIKAVGLLPIEVTPQHPFLVQLWDRRYPKRKGKNRKFLTSDWIVSNNLEAFDSIQVPLLSDECRQAVLDRRIELKGGPRSKKYVVVLNKAALKVCGLYLAEGSIRGDNRTVQFTLNMRENSYADVVIQWARSIGIPYSTALGRGSRTIYLYSKALATWLSSQFGNGAYSKVIPDWAMFSARAEALALLEYYFRGDGSLWDESRSALAANTRSVTLAQQVQLLLLWNHYPCCLDSTLDHGAPRWRMSVGGQGAVDLASCWSMKIPPKGLGRSSRYNHIKLESRYAHFPVRSVEEVDYVGDVWNLEIEDDHSYCVPAAVHNCWIEKDALVGIIQGICHELDVPYLSCRGYTSQSEMWNSAMRLRGLMRKGLIPVIFHLGDHDPSGKDMTRDIVDRLELFMGGVKLERLALNMDQIEEFNPPPSPAKLTDSRCLAYIAEFGDDSWELDALEPAVINGLIRTAVTALIDPLKWRSRERKRRDGRRKLQAIADNWIVATEAVEGA